MRELDQIIYEEFSSSFCESVLFFIWHVLSGDFLGLIWPIFKVLLFPKIKLPTVKIYSSRISSPIKSTVCCYRSICNSHHLGSKSMSDPLNLCKWAKDVDASKPFMNSISFYFSNYWARSVVSYWGMPFKVNWSCQTANSPLPTSSLYACLHTQSLQFTSVSPEVLDHQPIQASLLFTLSIPLPMSTLLHTLHISVCICFLSSPNSRPD